MTQLLQNEIKFVDKILELYESDEKLGIFYAFLHDPVFMHTVLFGRELPPHQRVAMRLMWFRPIYVGTDGYRAGKSATATYVQLQQCALISGWQEAILSHTARGAYYLFRDHIKYQYDTNPLFRALVAKRPTMGAEWRIEFKNGSSITAYPSDLLNNSMRLESLSLHGATIDEVTSFPNADVIWDVMLNRVTMPVPDVAARLGITNTVRLLGAAKYTFQTIYRPHHGKGGLVHHVIREMGQWANNKRNGDPLDYVFVSFNIAEHLPPDEVCWACGGDTAPDGVVGSKEFVRCKKCGYTRVAWRKFFATTLQRLEDAKSLMGNRLFRMRWLGKWQDTSEEVYDVTAVRAMARPDCRVELMRERNDNAIYALGVDIGTGASERHSASAITVVKHVRGDPHYRIVFSMKLKCSLTHLSGYIHNLVTLFSPVVVMIDAGGGGVWLVDKDHLGNSAQTIPTPQGIVRKVCTPLLLMDDNFSEHGNRILQLFTPKNFLLRNSLGGMTGPDQLINFAHELVNGLISSGHLISPEQLGSEEDYPLLRKEVLDCINECRSGLLSIGIVQDHEGNPVLTNNGFFSYYPKPDLAYSLVYAIVALYLYLQMGKDFVNAPALEGIGVLAESIDYVGSGSPQGEDQSRKSSSEFAILI